MLYFASYCIVFKCSFQLNQVILHYLNFFAVQMELENKLLNDDDDKVGGMALP